MTVTSPAFFAFLAGVYLLYWPLSRFRALSLGVILFANWFFYARWSLWYLAIIPAASTLDFLIGLALDRASNPALRRLLILLSVALNLGLLVTAKQLPFLGALSLSFYAFQALTYTLDIYRRDARATTSLLSHLTAVSFFPTTLSGPITRVPALIAQIEAPERRLAPEDGGRALFLIGLGLLKKLVIADYLGGNLVDRVFDFPNLYTGSEVAIAVVAYAFQLYYDFSGYTDVARGSGLLLGLKLPENFNRPYSAANLPDFWRRWHITFSNWLRDYLFFSLPGHRARSRLIPAFNIVVTMALGGLWHGVSWNFLIWGLLHGVALGATRLWQSRRGRRAAPPSRKRYALLALATFFYVCLTWIFFRAPDLTAALAILARIGSLTFSLANISWPIALALGGGIAAHFVPSAWFERSREFYAARPFYIQGPALAAVIVALYYAGSAGSAPFIYTRF
jgi:alginate O-acetyltransferase complex protein AlgI